MNEDIAARFTADYNLSAGDIRALEDFYQSRILPGIRSRYLSHLVATIEDMVNDKKKREYIQNLETSQPGTVKTVKDNLNRRHLRFFSIVLRPLENGKFKARTSIIPGGGALITYWKDLDAAQKRILIAHELGHIVSRYLLDDGGAGNEEGLATLFGVIALIEKDHFYRDEAPQYVHRSDLVIYDEVKGLCKRPA